MSAVPYLLEFLNDNKIDIICLSEHWLRKSQFHFLNSIDKQNYLVFGKCADEHCPEKYSYSARGGVAIMVSKTLSPYVTELVIDSNRICGIELKLPNLPSIFFLSIYLPAITQPNEAFVNELEYLMDTYKSYSNHGTVYILGDFNCKIGGPRYSFTQDRRSQLLESLLIDNNSISLHVQDFAKGPVCTFQSYEDGPKTGIDHIVTNNENTRDIYNVFVPDESIFNVSDHKPIACTLLIEQCRADSDNLYESVMADKVSWTKALEMNSVNDYSFAVSQFLWSVQMPSLPATKEDIELYYKTIIVAVQKADKETLPHKQFVKHIKPYWTKVVDLSHKTMLNKRSLWILNGKVHDRSDQFFADYKHAKRTFRNEMDKAYNEHIMNIANRMEESIDNDQRYVWSVLKSRRKQKTFCRELNLNGITHTNESEICEAWADHFESIFQFDSKLTNSANINLVKHEVNKIRQTQKEIKAPINPFEFEEISNICKSLCNNKSTGLDNVSYEHIKYGGKTLQKHLCNLFNLIIQTRYTPLDWKTSVIIPLFKGGNKNKTDPNSYRGISLTSCIAKIFEKSLYPRFDSLHIKFPHQSQMAYQKELSSIHASFNLQEPIRHYIERNSDVIVVLLDSTKAFDTVWHDALLYKLHKYGVTGDLWLLIDEIYSDMRSSVLFNGRLSRWFELKRGVRQGGVLSALLYLVYINDLLCDIEDSKLGCVLLDISVSSSVQADDIALLSTTEKGMQQLINICQTYSEKWAFKFSPTKSNVLRYSKKNKNVTSNLTLYNDIIPLVTSAKHVGILLNCKFRSMDQTLNACRVLRSTALSVLNSGIHPSILNPLTCSKIILQICYSKALYGCELWNNLTQTELTMLERSHRFVCKIIQGLPKRTRSDKCTSLLGWFSVESIINRCKLLFFGRLCRLKSSALPKRIMISRLMEFKHKCVPEQLGFIPDIYKAAEKYNITDYIVNFANTGSFPSKKLWSIIVNQNINASEETWWSYRISCDNDFYMFRHIHSAIKPHKAWTIAKQFPELRVSAKYVIDLCSIVRYEDEHLLCDKCGKFFLNIVEHLLVSCDFIQDKRDDLWEDIININPIQFSVYMDSLSAHEFTTTILSCNTSYELENDELTFFSKTCVRHVETICRDFYNR
ncbi:unnamed protein product [Mytilus edulis]|uniref:Reverse transcriptase domain-containing protein n=1 Tax=Mytilus edulis TaxID=6550 RepID=A0A8S3S202_MYTED|nr:unnamed protein product [Mytilus edulis]